MDCWHREIERANTEADVVTRAQDYLLLWSPVELAPLARESRNVRIESGADIDRLKRTASAASITPYTPELHELASYLWHAARRIGEIRRSHHA